MGQETPVTIDLWTTPQPALDRLIERLGQADWVAFRADWHQESHLLVAHVEGVPVGFLRYVIQQIGVEEDLEPLQVKGDILTEAKVIAFGVALEQRRQGIGRQLQLALIDRSKRAGCYQIRSHSSLDNTANHQLKLSLGFALHPLLASPNKDGYYFILSLWE